ncbi:hypothetical protein QQ045_016369 [Rhodiola kirilowii]
MCMPTFALQDFDRMRLQKWTNDIQNELTSLDSRVAKIAQVSFPQRSKRDCNTSGFYSKYQSWITGSESTTRCLGNTNIVVKVWTVCRDTGAKVDVHMSQLVDKFKEILRRYSTKLVRCHRQSKEPCVTHLESRQRNVPSEEQD